MKTTFFITQKPKYSMALSLNSIWILEADSSYDVKRFSEDSKDLVAIRTTKGRGIITMEGKGDFNLTPGTLLIVKERAIKRYFCAEDCWNFKWFIFSCAKDECLPINNLIEIEQFDNEDFLVSQSIEFLKREDHIMSGASSSFFSALINLWVSKHFESLIPVMPYEVSLKNISEYIRNNIDKKLNAIDLASQIGLCEKRFREVFTDYFGTSPKKYIHIYRMQSAEALLKNTSMAIYEVSEKLGFSSQFHFSREFKKYFRVSPSKYRKV